MARGGTARVRLPPCEGWTQGVLRLSHALLKPPRRGRVRYEQPLTGGNPVAWLARRRGAARFYFEDRDRRFVISAAGVAEERAGAAFGVVDDLLDAAATGEAEREVRVIAWGRFDPETLPDEAWAPFGQVRAILPLVEFRVEDGESVLAVNLVPDDGAGSPAPAARRAQELLLGENASPPTPWTRTAVTPTTPEAFTAAVEDALVRIRRGEIRKVVLARLAVRSLPRPPSPTALLAALREGYQGAYPFLIEPRRGVAFLGASPERLYLREGHRLATEALAGTALRGASPDEDARLADELLESGKDRLEHELVRAHIVERLVGLAAGVEHSDVPEVVSLRNLQHLRTPIQGHLGPDAGDALLLQALHPTPAVCGVPREGALRLLRTREGFDRGVYGGPVGCFGRDRSEVAVALRSALLLRSQARLFAGAGVVEGSDPAAEWRETSAKLAAFDGVLAVEGPPGDATDRSI
jgi:menaquinone-specific isochorismate synthase